MTQQSVRVSAVLAAGESPSRSDKKTEGGAFKIIRPNFSDSISGLAVAGSWTRRALYRLTAGKASKS